MNQNPAATDWATARGEKWGTQLAGMEAMLAPVDGPLIRALNLAVPCRIADIGCGGGGTALEILREAPVGSIVHGFDISPTLIALARKRVSPDDRNITFEIADIAAVAPEAPYDRLVSRFGVMFFDDPRAAFANLFHWLAPGGRFAFAVWDRSAENPWVTSVFEAVAEVVDVPEPDPDGPGPARYAETGKLFDLLVQAGFGNLHVHDWRGALPIGGRLLPAEAADFALASFSSLSEMLTKAGHAAHTKARESLTARFSRHTQDGAVRMNACVHIVTGARM